MKEYNLDAAKRKFENTLLFYKEDGVLQNNFCYRILQTETGIVYLLNPSLMTTDPLYAFIDNGIYENPKEEHGCLLVLRKKEKTFKIGICTDTHHFIVPRAQYPQLTSNTWHNTNLLKKITVGNEDIEKALRKEGPISNKYWISHNKVYYLMTEVGLRHGNTFILNEVVKKDLKKILAPFNPKYAT